MKKEEEVILKSLEEPKKISKYLSDLSISDQLSRYKSAGTIDTDDEYLWNESTMELKEGCIIVNCPYCDARHKPLLSKTTMGIKSGSYYPGHSIVTGSIAFFTTYRTYCRKCKNYFLFTLESVS